MQKKSKLPHYLTIPRMSCVFLSIVMVAVQWVPFWTIDGKKYSISDLVWFIYKNSEIKTFLSSLDAANTVNDAVLVPLFILIAAIATFLACFMSKSKGYVVAPILCALITIVGYPVRAELRAGFLWFLHLIPAVLMLGAVVLEILGVFNKKEEK